MNNTTHHDDDDHHEEEHGHGEVGNKTVDLLYLCSVIVIGLLFNAIIIFIFAKTRRLRTCSNYIIINLTISDLLICGYIVPVVTVNRILEHNAMNHNGCIANSFIVFVAMGVCNVSFMMVAIDRYIFIFHRQFYGLHITKMRMVIILGSVWCLWACYGFIILFGYQGFEYEPDAFVCFFADSKNDLASAIVLSFFDFLLPIIIVIIFYVIIFVRMYNVRKATKSKAGPGTSTNIDFKREIILLLTVCLTIVLFIICWGPYILHSYVVRAGSTLSSVVHKMMYWLALCNGSINGIVFSLLHGQFREEILALLLPRRKVGPTSGTATE